ncbi:MAG: hypothetical protein JRJ59_06180 [Deltaproteobacteria bacterium]|nr:hypothetical protein [Deltaproteobacteria bacterium]
MTAEIAGELRVPVPPFVGLTTGAYISALLTVSVAGLDGQASLTVNAPPALATGPGEWMAAGTGAPSWNETNRVFQEYMTQNTDMLSKIELAVSGGVRFYDLDQGDTGHWAAQAYVMASAALITAMSTVTNLAGKSGTEVNVQEQCGILNNALAQMDAGVIIARFVGTQMKPWVLEKGDMTGKWKASIEAIRASLGQWAAYYCSQDGGGGGTDCVDSQGHVVGGTNFDRNSRRVLSGLPDRSHRLLGRG